MKGFIDRIGSAVLTVIPRESASKVCRLGYKCVCSLTPWPAFISTYTDQVWSDKTRCWGF